MSSAEKYCFRVYPYAIKKTAEKVCQINYNIPIDIFLIMCYINDIEKRYRNYF